MQTTTPAIQVEHLTKSFRRTTAVADVSLRVERGEVFGILGANGAGKTTTVDMMSGLRKPDRGHVSVLGHDPQRERNAVRQILGVQLQQALLHWSLTTQELIKLYQSFYPELRSADELLAMTGLQSQAKTRFEQLSGGQQQRLSVALALVGRPHVLILDELTTGLDPRSRREIWQSVESLRDGHISIVLVSHAMDEVERLCDRVAVMDSGRIIAQNTPTGLLRDTNSQTLEDAFLFLTARHVLKEYP